MKTSIIIDTGSDISMAYSSYHTEIKLPTVTNDTIPISSIGGKVIKLMIFVT